MLDKKLHTILKFLIIASIIFMVVFRYYEYVISKNVLLNVFAPCDSQSEKCFVSDPDSAWFDFQLAPYKKIEILEHNAPQCLEEHTCDSFTCGKIENCKETKCSEQNIEEGETCVGPGNSFPENQDDLIYQE